MAESVSWLAFFLPAPSRLHGADSGIERDEHTPHSCEGSAGFTPDFPSFSHDR